MPTYTDTVKFDSIIVLESLPTGERKTGENLFDKVLQPWAAANPPLTALFNKISSKAHFLQALRAVDDQLAAKGSKPILHIEAHGERNAGIRLANDETISWEELRDGLTVINRRSGFNLLVVMAMCEGWWLSRLLLPMEPSPFWGVIGPTAPVWNSDLEGAMSQLYSTLFQTFDARAALDRANKGAHYVDWGYRLETAEMMYCKVFHRYVGEMSTPTRLAERENAIVAEIVRRHGRNLETAFEARQRARTMLADHRAFFDFCRPNFFMLNDLPQNRKRFQLTFDDCAPKAS